MGENPADCHRFVERYPEAFPAGACRSGEGVWLAMGAFRVHGFLFARIWAVRARKESNGGKQEMRRTRTWLPLLAVLVLVVIALTTGAFAAGEAAAAYFSPI